jgi:hypothetical protein
MAKVAENVLMLKTRIAMLWVFIALVLIVRSMFSGLDQVAAGKGSQPLSPEMQLWGTGGALVIFAIPFLCMTLRDSLNRAMNLLLGIFFTVAGIAGTGVELVHQLAASNTSFYLMDTAATIAPALITFYAYRWPKAISKSKEDDDLHVVASATKR